MKNKLFLLAIAAIGFVSCQKDENTISSSTTVDGGANKLGTSGSTGIGSTPMQFTKKVLLECFTGADYGKVPQNDFMISQLQAQYPDRVIAASFHYADQMSTVSTSNLVNFVSNGTMPMLPAVILNRFPFNGKIINETGTWYGNVAYTLSGTPNVGLAIQSTVQNRVLNMNIHVGFNAAVTGNYKLVAYLVENSVQHVGTGYDQANGFNTNTSSPFYNLGDPILNYSHNNVMRLQATTMSGITVPSTYQVTGGHMIQSLSMDLPVGMNFNNTYIIAYVYNTSNLFVMNTQIAKIGTVKPWD